MLVSNYVNHFSPVQARVITFYKAEGEVKTPLRVKIVFQNLIASPRWVASRTIKRRLRHLQQEDAVVYFHLTAAAA